MVLYAGIVHDGRNYMFFTMDEVALIDGLIATYFVADSVSESVRVRYYHLLLILGRLQGDVVVVCLRHGQVQHIRRLDVRHIFEYGDQLRQVVELGKAGLGTVARPLGVEFVKILFVDFLNLMICP